MKKFVTISLLVFVVILTGVAVFGFVSNKAKKLQTGSANNTPVKTDQTNNINTPPNTLSLTMAELAKHNTQESCWLLISNKIYDVTAFLPNHPGQAKTILPNCGKDATEAFGNKGRTNGKPHSQGAFSALTKYYLGDLLLSVAPKTKDPSGVNPNQVQPVSPEEDEEE